MELGGGDGGGGGVVQRRRRRKGGGGYCSFLLILLTVISTNEAKKSPGTHNTSLSFGMSHGLYPLTNTSNTNGLESTRPYLLMVELDGAAANTH